MAGGAACSASSTIIASEGDGLELVLDVACTGQPHVVKRPYDKVVTEADPYTTVVARVEVAGTTLCTEEMAQAVRTKGLGSRVENRVIAWSMVAEHDSAGSSSTHSDVPSAGDTEVESAHLQSSEPDSELSPRPMTQDSSSAPSAKTGVQTELSAALADVAGASSCLLVVFMMLSSYYLQYLPYST
jgi:hypothetical protein